MGARYLGNKTRSLSSIVQTILALQPARVVDIFAGTGSVASAVTRSGIPVLANDHLLCATVMTSAACARLQDVEFSAWEGTSPQQRYESALRQLNSIQPEDGFFSREYTPSGASAAGFLRYYFTEDNGRRLDAIRRAIRLWSECGLLTELEDRLVLGDLIHAANAVANIAGTYGCFLQPWSPSALNTLTLVPRKLLLNGSEVDVSNLDYRAVRLASDDVVYFDPPYTKRQYAAYYHILETLAHGDEPEVSGVTGLRPWQQKASPYCYSTLALKELSKFVEECHARAIVMSYNSDGHMLHTEILRVLGSRGSVEVSESDLPRYSSNTFVGSRERIMERLYVCELVPESGENRYDAILAEAAG